MPASIGMRWHPNSPKSWKYGNHVTSLSSDVPPSMARRARMFANEVAVREARALGHTRAAGGELEHGGIVMLRDVAVVLLEIDDAGLRDEVFAGYERGPRPFEHVRQHGKGRSLDESATMGALIASQT